MHRYLVSEMLTANYIQYVEDLVLYPEKET